MREITDHVVEGDLPGRQVKIKVVDPPGHGGASHRYKINGFWPEQPVVTEVDIPFQNGTIGQYGVNGITNEALLAIVIDRLRSFQAGPYPCEANALALDHCVEALESLKDRTRQRLARGVEGINQA